MHKILILEDNKDQAQIISKWIHEKYSNWEICIADSLQTAGKEISNSLTDTPFTLFLLDIQLEDLDFTNRDGFLFANQIREIKIYYKTPILFLTQVLDAGLYAFSNFHCYNYITKPYTKEMILGQIEQMLLTDYLSNTMIISDTSQICHQIFADDIKYVKASKAKKEIILKDSTITTRMNFPDLISTSNQRLVQCHKGYLINPDYVTSIDRQNRCFNIGADVIPVGRKYVDIFEIIH